MRVFKPSYVTPLAVPFDDGRRIHCVVTAIFHAKFDGTLCEERLLWEFAQEEVEGMVLDEGKPKTRGEFLVHGSCHAIGPDVRQSFVKAKVGELEKLLAVFGRRVFKMGVPSAPEPFESVPIRFTHAFGGEGFADNPTGKGFGGGELPQVEVRGQLIKSPSDRPPVAGFGRLDVQWPQRAKRIGTYDMKWFKTRFPGMSEDFDGTYFQLAMPDQWQKGFYRGDEAFSVVNMHPEKAQLDGALPNVTARCFVKRKGEGLVDVPMRIDTVHLFPHRERQVIVCRGTTPARSDLLEDVEIVGCGLEWIGRPKTREHYEAVFAARATRKKGALVALDDSPLLPETAPKPKERIVAPGEGLRQRQIERKMQHAYDAMKQKLADLELDQDAMPPMPKIDTSVDPDDVPPPAEPPTLEAVQEEIAKKRGEAIADLRAKVEEKSKVLKPEHAAKMKAELEATIAKIEKGHVGPPEFSRAKFRKDLEDKIVLFRNAKADPAALQKQLDDQESDARLRELESFVRDTYRQNVQHQGAPERLGRAASEELRTRVRILVDAGEPFEGVDLTGADLSGLDLRGANLKKAWLEATDLTGTTLDGADLEHAVLARASLPGADLKKCHVKGTNFSGADLSGADLSGLDVSSSFFVATDLTDAKLVGARIDRASLDRAKLVRTDLSDCKITNGFLIGMRFEGVSFRGATWEKTQFYQCTFVDVDLRRAALNMPVFIDTSIERARFDDAVLTKLQSVSIDRTATFVDCSFVGARVHLGLFRGAKLERCNFSHADFEKSDFSGATADGCTFQDARGVGARFVSARVRGCRFDRADLMTSFFGNATMDRASFEGANLFRSDFARSVGENVNMAGANVKRVRTVPKREETP